MTLAVRGGFDLPSTLGSRATHLVSRMGPFGGRALQRGRCAADRHRGRGRSGPCTAPPLELPAGGARLRVCRPSHRERFTDAAWDS